MNIWFMIWVFVAVFILGTSLWSYYILLKQKRAWESFSKKHNFQYLSSAVLKSPYLRGMFHDFEVVVFSDNQLAGTERQRNIRTTFQFTLKAPMPTEGAIGSPVFSNFINGLSLPDKYEPADFTGWNKDIVIRVKSVEPIRAYFTKERLSAFNALMVIKNNPAILLFSETETVLRIESTDPFDDAEKLERFLIKVSDAAKIISI